MPPQTVPQTKAQPVRLRSYRSGVVADVEAVDRHKQTDHGFVIQILLGLIEHDGIAILSSGYSCIARTFVRALVLSRQHDQSNTVRAGNLLDGEIQYTISQQYVRGGLLHRREET